MEPFPGTSFAVLSVSIVGILTISLLLLAYYLFLTRCGLLFFWRSDLQQLLHDDVAAHHRISVSVTVQEPPRRSGLEEAAIRRIPTFRYRCHGKPHHHLLPADATSAAAECAVCLADFRDGERLRLLPPCLHAFHIDCIDAWLQAMASCPLCRAAVVSGPAGMQLPRAAPAAAANDDDDIVIDIATSTSPSAATVAAEQPAASAAPSNERGGGGRSSGSFLPMRRSLSMDSCADKRFYLALQRMILQQNSSSSSGSPAAAAAREDRLMGSSKGEMVMSTAADTGRSSSRRLRRSFFSFSQSRGSRSAVLPL